MDTVLVGSTTPTPGVQTVGAAGTAVSDWLKSARKTWDALTRALASTRYSSAFFASLPSIYMIALITYVNVQFAKDLAGCVDAAYVAANPAMNYQRTSPFLFAPIISPMNTFVGSLLGVALAASLASILAIWQKWPGVLSFWTWTVEVLKDWFIVTFIILLFSWASAFTSASNYAQAYYQNSAGIASLSTCTLNIMVSMMLPAIFVWQISASVMTRQRMIFSGE